MQHQNKTTMDIEALQKLAMEMKLHGETQNAQIIDRIVSAVAELVGAAETASNYIHHVGANVTEKGLPHPQALLLERLDNAIANLKPKVGL
jgi:hypothetical protein